RAAGTRTRNAARRARAARPPSRPDRIRRTSPLAARRGGAVRRSVGLYLPALVAPLLSSGCLTAALFETAHDSCRTREVEECVARPTQLVRAARTADGALHVEVWY